MRSRTELVSFTTDSKKDAMDGSGTGQAYLNPTLSTKTELTHVENGEENNDFSPSNHNNKDVGEIKIENTEITE